MITEIEIRGELEYTGNTELSMEETVTDEALKLLVQELIKIIFMPSNKKVYQ